jgi:hypothetical protein
MAMAFEMSDDSVDRVRIVGYRNTVESCCSLLAMPGALVPDTLDQERDRTGQRLEGLHASVISLSLQIGLGIGYLLTGISLQLAGYRGGIKPTSEVIHGLRLSTALFPAVLSIAALIIPYRSPLSQGAADKNADEEHAPKLQMVVSKPGLAPAGQKYPCVKLPFRGCLDRF